MQVTTQVDIEMAEPNVIKVIAFERGAAGLWRLSRGFLVLPQSSGEPSQRWH
jgi:hypothetical protein